MYYSTTKKLGSKNKKKTLYRGSSLALSKDFAEGLAYGPQQRIFKKIFAEGLANGPRQRIFKKNKKSLSSV